MHHPSSSLTLQESGSKWPQALVLRNFNFHPQSNVYYTNTCVLAHSFKTFRIASMRTLKWLRVAAGTVRVCRLLRGVRNARQIFKKQASRKCFFKLLNVQGPKACIIHHHPSCSNGHKWFSFFRLKSPLSLDSSRLFRLSLLFRLK